MRPGDALRRLIQVGGRVIPVYHFGVLVTAGSVVHLGLEYGVALVALDEFASGLPVSVAFSPVDPPRAIARAFSRVGERGTFRAWHNCWSFADWCVGERR